jgi:exopolysaccharide production protein ExoZ
MRGAARQGREDGGGAADGVLQSIRTLRGLAALLVVGFHAAEKAGLSFKVGAIGVDLFFVISGFIIWVVTAQRPATPGAFLLNRAIRVVPLYWAITLLVAGLALLVPSLLASRVLDPARLLASLLFIPHLDAAGMPWPLLAPGWTLNYEAFFYLVFAAGLLLPRPARALALTAGLLLLAMLGILLRPQSAIAATYTSPLLLEFLGGLWLGRAWVARRLPGAGVGLVLLAGGIAGPALLAAGGHDADGWRVLAWGGPALLLVAGALCLEASGALPRRNPLGWLGDSSYALYLTHGLVIPALWRLLGGSAAFLPAAILLSCLVGLVTFLLFERPVTRWLRRRAARLPARRASPRLVPLGLAALALFLAGAGSTVLLARPGTPPGWPSCAVLGDSLAVGVAGVLPGCRSVARGGITSADYLAEFPPRLEAALVVVSLGANDWQGDTAQVLRALRSRLHARQVVWLLPNLPAIRPVIAAAARESGDLVVDTARHVGADGLHPNLTGYRAIAALLPAGRD